MVPPYVDMLPLRSVNTEGCSYPYGVFVYDEGPQTEVGLDLRAPSSGIMAARSGNITVRRNSRPPSQIDPGAAGSNSASSVSIQQVPLVAGRLGPSSDKSAGKASGQGANNRILEIFLLQHSRHIEPVTLWDVIDQWSLRSEANTKLLATVHDANGCLERVNRVERPIIRSDQVVKGRNKCIVAKLFAALFIAGNFTFERIVHDLVNCTESSNISTLVSSCMASSPSRLKNLPSKAIFVEYYRELQRNRELMSFLRLTAVRDEWDGMTETTIFQNGLATLMHNSLLTAALAFHKRLRVQSHVDAAEILGSEDIRCGLEECNISHRIPNLSRSSTLVVQHEARKLLVHICFDQARRLHVERYKCAPALPDTANYEEQQEYYDVLFTLIISSEQSLQLHYGFLKNLALKSFFHRFSHVVGNGRLAMAIYHYGVEKTKLTLNMVAFCGGMLLIELFRLCHWHTTNGDGLRKITDAFSKEDSSIFAACLQATTTATFSYQIELSDFLKELNSEAGLENIDEQRETNLAHFKKMLGDRMWFAM